MQGIKNESVLVYRDVMIPMRDGVRLATDIYVPAVDGAMAAGRFPVLVTRTPYGKAGLPGTDASNSNPYGACDLVRQGYIVAVQDKRGRYGSEGTYPGLTHDDGVGQNRDGYDTVEWLAKQPW